MHPSLNKRLQSTALHLKRLVRTSSRGGRIHNSSAPLLQMSGALVQLVLIFERAAGFAGRPGPSRAGKVDVERLGATAEDDVTRSW